MLDGGGDPDGFAARQLTAAHLRQADLVLGMTREHRAAAVELVPATVRRSFTLRSTPASLVRSTRTACRAGTPAERARASLPLAAALRRQAEADDDDVADPYRQGEIGVHAGVRGHRAGGQTSPRCSTPAEGQPSGCSAMYAVELVVLQRLGQFLHLRGISDHDALTHPAKFRFP